MKALIAKHRLVWSENKFIVSVIFGFVLLAASLFINYFAGQFADRNVSNTITDLILNNLPVENVAFLFIDGFGLFLLFVLALLALEPKHLPFLLKALALLVTVRSFFITLTHLAPPIPISASEWGAVGSLFTFNGDLFFSAHTAIPFLFALLFWQHKILRWVFVGFSIFFATVVLLGHLHYSIDVFAAYFITFTVYSIAKKFFPADFRRFDGV